MPNDDAFRTYLERVEELMSENLYASRTQSGQVTPASTAAALVTTTEADHTRANIEAALGAPANYSTILSERDSQVGAALEAALGLYARGNLSVIGLVRRLIDVADLDIRDLVTATGRTPTGRSPTERGPEPVAQMERARNLAQMERARSLTQRIQREVQREVQRVVTQAYNPQTPYVQGLDAVRRQLELEREQEQERMISEEMFTGEMAADWGDNVIPMPPSQYSEPLRPPIQPRVTQPKPRIITKSEPVVGKPKTWHDLVNDDNEGWIDD